MNKIEVYSETFSASISCYSCQDAIYAYMGLLISDKHN